MSHILKVKGANGNWVDIPAIVGPKGEPGGMDADIYDTQKKKEDIFIYADKAAKNFVINLSYEDGNLGADKTFEEIKEAYTIGKNVVCMKDGEIYRLHALHQGEDGYQCVFSDCGGNENNYVKKVFLTDDGWSTDGYYLVTTTDEAPFSIMKGGTGASTAKEALANLGGCRVIADSYTGTGDYGSDYPNRLEFDGKPMVLFFWGAQIPLIRGSGTAAFIYRNNSEILEMDELMVEWGDNYVQWYHPWGADYQQNTNRIEYPYVVILG